MICLVTVSREKKVVGIFSVFDPLALVGKHRFLLKSALQVGR